MFLVQAKNRIVQAKDMIRFMKRWVSVQSITNLLYVIRSTVVLSTQICFETKYNLSWFRVVLGSSERHDSIHETMVSVQSITKSPPCYAIHIRYSFCRRRRFAPSLICSWFKQHCSSERHDSSHETMVSVQSITNLLHVMRSTVNCRPQFIRGYDHELHFLALLVCLFGDTHFV